MKYIHYINELIRKKVAETDKLVLFGQNISAGSCVGGLTSGLRVLDGNLVLNTPNSENTLCGIGFGLMMNGVNSVFFMKQQDFLLLSIDHLVNTYNFVRLYEPKASFTIFCPIIDCGYQGLQSSLNNFSDFCSIARCSGYAITNKKDAEIIINTHLVSPGFRIIGISQRLWDSEILDLDLHSENEGIFNYHKGRDATIVCFNFSLPQGVDLWKKMQDKGLNASLFSINAMTPVDWSMIIDNIEKTKKLVIMDDGKSANLSFNSFLVKVLDKIKLEKKIILIRDVSGDWLSPQKDVLKVDYDKIIEKIK